MGLRCSARPASERERKATRMSEFEKFCNPIDGELTFGKMSFGEQFASCLQDFSVTRVFLRKS